MNEGSGQGGGPRGCAAVMITRGGAVAGGSTTMAATNIMAGGRTTGAAGRVGAGAASALQSGHSAQSGACRCAGANGTSFRSAPAWQMTPTPANANAEAGFGTDAASPS